MTVNPLDHLKLIHYVLARWRIHPSNPYYADLYQTGYLGLHRACELFDPERGAQFSTYAIWHIQAAVRRAQKRRSPAHIPERHWLNGTRITQVSLDHWEPASVDQDTDTMMIRNVLTAIDELPQQNREAVLGVLDGETHRDIAARVGSNKSTVNMRYRKGVELLRERLAMPSLD